MFVAGHLVFTLGMVTGSAHDLILSLLPQSIAHFSEYGHHHIVEERMALNIEIGSVGSDSQRFDVFFGLKVLNLIAWDLIL